MVADDKEAAPKKKAGADSGALTSAPFSGSDITDKEGASPKDNPLAAVATPAEAITAGVVSADTPKEKSSAGADEASSFFSSAPLSPEMDMVPRLMA